MPDSLGVVAAPGASLSTIINVPAGETGPVAALDANLTGTVSYSAIWGTTSSLAINSSTGVVSLTAALVEGATAVLKAHAQNVAGDAIERTFTVLGVAAENVGPVSAYRANLQIGLTSTSPFNASRYYTNLAASSKKWNTASGVVGPMGGNIEGDVTGLFHPQTGGITGLLPTANQIQGYVQNPWPKGPEAGRWMRIWCNRPDATFALTVGNKSHISEVRFWNGGAYIDYYFTWSTPNPVNNGTVGYKLFPGALVGAASNPCQVFAAEIADPANPGAELLSTSMTTNSWDWITDPTTDFFHPSAAERLSSFGVIRPMDLQLTNDNYPMISPTEVANRAYFGGSVSGSIASIRGVAATVSWAIAGETVIFQAMMSTSKAKPEFAGSLYAAPAWRPWGAFGNEMWLEIAVDAVPYITYSWDKPTRKLVMTLPTGTTWEQIPTLMTNHVRAIGPQQALGPYTSLIEYPVIPGALNGVIVTPQASKQFSGGLQGPCRGGLGVEMMVEMANKSNSALWFQIPINADEGWVRFNIGYIRDNLNPDLELYVELGNELWNTNFTSNSELIMWGIANNPHGYGSGSYISAYLWAWAKLFVVNLTIAKDEYGLVWGRTLVAVFAGQATVSGSLHWPKMEAFPDIGATWKALIDKFAIAPYWTSTLSSLRTYLERPWMPDTAYFAAPNGGNYPILRYNGIAYIIRVNHTSTSGSEPGTPGGAAYYAELTPEAFEPYGKEAIDNVFTSSAPAVSYAAAAGKPLIAYEYGIGNQWSNTISSGVPNTPMYNFVTALMHSDVMYKLYSYSLWKFYTVCGPQTVISQFGDSGLCVPDNLWYYQDYPGVPDSIAPKRRAVETFLATGPYNPYSPALIDAPVISGTLTQGQVLSVSTGTWSNIPISFTYQWKRDDVAISGAVSSTYHLDDADVGKTMSCTVTAINASGSNSTTVVATGVVAPLTPAVFPQLAHIGMFVQASDLAGTLADGAAVTSWTDPISGASATPVGANSPTFRATGYSGKPSVEFAGPTTPQALSFGRPSALTTLLDGTNKTVIAVVANVTTGSTYGMVLAAHQGGGGACFINAGASNNGQRPGTGTTPTNASAALPLMPVDLTAIGGVQGSDATRSHGVYQNGTRTGLDTSFSPTTTTRNISIGGTADNQASAAFKGHVIAIIAWNVALTPAEMLQAQMAICDRYGTLGQYPWTGRKFYIFDGDSQTEGFGRTFAEYTWPNLLMAAMGVPIGSYTVTALNGIAQSTLNTKAALNVDPIFGVVTSGTGATGVVLSNLEWYNQATVAPGPYNASISYWTARKAANPAIKCVQGDSLDAASAVATPTWHINRAAYNAALLSSVSPADALIRLSTNANIGVDGSAAVANAYWQADLKHPTCNGATGTGHAEMAAIALPVITAL